MKKYFSDSSSISLIFSNLIVIILAVVQKWEISTVLWVYWMQSIIIGFFNFLRILSLKKFSATAFFFAFHYGFFHFVYAIFLFNSFRSNQSFDFAYLFLGGFIFFINHLFSYQQNKVADEQKTQNIGQLMFAPYARIVPMHLVIIFGAFLGQSTLIIFLLLKTIADLILHTIKHKVDYFLSKYS